MRIVVATPCFVRGAPRLRSTRAGPSRSWRAAVVPLWLVPAQLRSRPPPHRSARGRAAGAAARACAALANSQPPPCPAAPPLPKCPTGLGSGARSGSAPPAQRAPPRRAPRALVLVDAEQAHLVHEGRLCDQEHECGDESSHTHRRRVVAVLPSQQEERHRHDGEELLVARQLHAAVHLLPKGELVICALVRRYRAALVPVEQRKSDPEVRQLQHVPRSAGRQQRAQRQPDEQQQRDVAAPHAGRAHPAHVVVHVHDGRVPRVRTRRSTRRRRHGERGRRRRAGSAWARACRPAEGRRARAGVRRALPPAVGARRSLLPRRKRRNANGDGTGTVFCRQMTRWIRHLAPPSARRHLAATRREKHRASLACRCSPGSRAAYRLMRLLALATLSLLALPAPAAGRGASGDAQLLLSKPALCFAHASSELCNAANGCAWRSGACGPLPREEVGLLIGAGESACEGAKSEADCAAVAEDCRWCLSRAVPSMCVAAADAARLPPSVFKCAAPQAAVAAE